MKRTTTFMGFALLALVFVSQFGTGQQAPVVSPVPGAVDAPRGGGGRGQQAPALKTSIDYPGGFAKFSNGACQIWRRAPLIGEHNQEIYGQELAMSPSQIAELQKQGVI
jgi:hypothetical protein